MESVSQIEGLLRRRTPRGSSRRVDRPEPAPHESVRSGGPLKLGKLICQAFYVQRAPPASQSTLEEAARNASFPSIRPHRSGPPRPEARGRLRRSPDPEEGRTKTRIRWRDTAARRGRRSARIPVVRVRPRKGAKSGSRSSASKTLHPKTSTASTRTRSSPGRAEVDSEGRQRVLMGLPPSGA